MGRLWTLLALAVIFLASARAAQRRKTTPATDQPVHQPGRTPVAQAAPTSTTNATGRVVPLWTMIGTVLAGVAALAALVVSSMTFTIQQQQHEEQQQRRLAGFASKVTWWTEHTAQGQSILAIQNSGYEPMPASVKFAPFALLDWDFERNDRSEELRDFDPVTPSPQVTRRSSPVSSPTQGRSALWDTTSGVVDIGALPPCSISRLTLTPDDQNSFTRIEYVKVVDPAGMAWSRQPSGLLVRDNVNPIEGFIIKLEGREYYIESGGERFVRLSGGLTRTSAPYCSGPAD